MIRVLLDLLFGLKGLEFGGRMLLAGGKHQDKTADQTEIFHERKNLAQ